MALSWRAPSPPRSHPLPRGNLHPVSDWHGVWKLRSLPQCGTCLKEHPSFRALCRVQILHLPNLTFFPSPMSMGPESITSKLHVGYYISFSESGSQTAQSSLWGLCWWINTSGTFVWVITEEGKRRFWRVSLLLTTHWSELVTWSYNHPI